MEDGRLPDAAFPVKDDVEALVLDGSDHRLQNIVAARKHPMLATGWEGVKATRSLLRTKDSGSLEPTLN